MNLQIESKTMNRTDVSSCFKRNTLTDTHPAERHSPPVLLLDADGVIRECDQSVESIFGYRQHELIWQHISCLFPKFMEIALMQGNRLNPLLNYICHCDHLFEAVSKQSGIVICNLNFFLVEHNGSPSLRLIVRPVAKANA